MTSVVSDKPYLPVPPYHGTLWPRLLYLYVPRFLRRRYGVEKVEVVGADGRVTVARAAFAGFSTLTGGTALDTLTGPAADLKLN